MKTIITELLRGDSLYSNAARGRGRWTPKMGQVETDKGFWLIIRVTLEVTRAPVGTSRS